MDLQELLRSRKSEVAELWSDLTLRTYPATTAGFFIGEKDPFRNPVGGTVRRCVATLLDGLLGDTDDSSVVDALDGIIRLRAVQDFTPGQAVGFVFLFREALRGVLGDKLAACPTEQQSELGDRLDALAMRAFDVFTACRQRLFELRANEAKARVHSLLKRAGVLDDEPVGSAAEPAATKGGCAV